MTVLDRRLHVYRDDLADARLRGQVTAARFGEGQPARVAVPVADLRRAPRADAGLDTQLLLGDTVQVFDEADGWAWVQATRDNYVGYIPSTDLAEAATAPTHVVSVPRTFVYPGPDMKLPAARALSLGSQLAITGFEERRGTHYALTASGEGLIARHLAPIDELAPDYVAVAETLERTPYLWGGASAFGIDCSGLVQLSMRMAGRSVLRDSDMQASGLGEPIDPAQGLRRGDLVFWKGHAAILTDPQTILHANGHTMQVSREGLADAVARIGYLYGQPTGYRRP